VLRIEAKAFIVNSNDTFVYKSVEIIFKVVVEMDGNEALKSNYSDHWF